MRGFVYTFIFSSLFFLLLLSTALFIVSIGKSALSQANQTKQDRAGHAMDDLATDLLHHLDLTVASNPINTTSKTNLTFTDTMPNGLAAPGTEFSDWAALAEETFTNSSNADISLETTAFAISPNLQVLPYGLTYRYDDLSKSQLFVHGNSSVTNYSLVVRLNRDINSTNDTDWTWSGGTTSLFVVLDMVDSEGEQLFVKGGVSGYVDPTVDNRFILHAGTSGNLTVDVGTFDSLGTPSLKIARSGLRARLNTTVLLNGTPEVTVFAPILTTVNEQQSNLIVWEG